MSKFMKIRSLGDELFHAGGRADRQTERQKWRSSWSLLKIFRTHLKLFVSFIVSPCIFSIH